MAVSAVVNWAATRSAALVAVSGDLGKAVVGTLGAGGTVVAMVVALWSGATGGLPVDRPSPEHAATSRPAAKRARTRWPRR